MINIRQAKRGGAKAIIGIAGPSGSGKTYTALLMARGMVTKANEIGFLDTENKRGSLYADILDGEFLIGDLYPPFSPQRYSEAIKAFQAAGVKVLVIDSVSHEWEGEGGCDDIANNTTGKIANWNLAKREHKGFMNTLLQCNMHIICCIRAREKVKVEKINGKSEFIPQGMQPSCEKNFMFEMTASLMMEDEGKSQKFLKIPSFLKEAFGSGTGYIGNQTGKKIIQWLEVGEKEDPEVTLIKSQCLMATEKGIAGLMELWESLTPEQQNKMKPHFGVYKASAKAYDEAAKASQEPSPADKESERISHMINDCLTVDELNDLKASITEEHQLLFDTKMESLTKQVA